MTRWRTAASLVVALIVSGNARAQTFKLSEASSVDTYHHIQLSMSLTGTLKLQQDAKEIALKESATATHDFVERVLETGAENTATKSARVYKEAKVIITVNADKVERRLRPDCSFLMAQRERGRENVMTWSPHAALTREELDVADHFDTLAITGLLPSKAVAVGQTWSVGNLTVLALCHLQGLSEQKLVAKLERMDGKFAVFTVSGPASGIDLGAVINTTIQATCRFDTQLRCLVGVEWTQKDERGPGPVSPAASLEITVKLRRTPVEAVTELSDVILVPVRDVQPPRERTDLFFKDSKNRFELVYSREWHLVGRSQDHVVLRLMDRGEFVAQVSITPWKKVEPGKHLSPEDVKSIVANSPGWAQENLIKAEEIKLPSGQWAYLVAGEGDLDGVRAVQYFYLIAGPGGDQAILTFTMTSGQTQKLGSRDLEFVQGFLLPGASRRGGQTSGGRDY